MIVITSYSIHYTKLYDTNAAKFIEELKTGQAKWNGALDFSIEKTLTKIKEKATVGLWAEAQAMAAISRIKGRPLMSKSRISGLEGVLTFSTTLLASSNESRLGSPTASGKVVVKAVKSSGLELACEPEAGWEVV